MAIDWASGRGRLTADGKALEWAAFGPQPEERPVIVLLHEGLGCLALWRDFPERLVEATGVPVFAFSRAGYGQSDPVVLPRPLDYLTREAVDVLPDVLGSVGAASYVLVGHSDGATIAAVHAGAVRDPRVRGVALMAPHFFTEPVALAGIAETRTVFETTDMKARMAKYHRDPEIAFRGWSDTWLDPGFASWNVEDAIDAFGVPALALQGRDDQYATLAQIEVVARRSPMPVHTVVLEECRHSPHLEQPEQTVAAIARFVSEFAGA